MKQKNKINSQEEYFNDLMKKDKKTLSYMLLAAVHKLELARRALKIASEYELEEVDNEIIQKVLMEL